MTTEKRNIRYLCPICDEDYENESEAEICLDNCSTPTEAVEEIDVPVFCCDMCGKEWDDEEEAEECEQNHREREDLYYGRWISNKDKEALLEAAKHPSQMRITRW